MGGSSLEISFVGDVTHRPNPVDGVMDIKMFAALSTARASWYCREIRLPSLPGHVSHSAPLFEHCNEVSAHNIGFSLQKSYMKACQRSDDIFKYSYLYNSRHS